MTLYKEHQTGWLLIVPTVIMFLFLTWLYAFQLGDRPMSIGSYFMVMGILAMMLALMYRMQTEVTNEHVSIRFGVGLIKRIVPLTSVQSVTVISNAWYYGWGVRIMPKGWLYNMSGTKGVELQLKSGRVVRIGSSNPEELAKVVESVIAR